MVARGSDDFQWNPRFASGDDEVAVRVQAKKSLRGRMAALRRAIPKPQRILRSGRIAAQLQTCPAWQRACRIGAYAPMNTEIDVTDVIDEAAGRGARVFLPRVNPADGSMSFADRGEPLERSPMGVFEPPPDRKTIPPEALEVILVPLLAVDTRGYRLGYGKGYYDRFLPLAKNATWIGLAFDFQVLAELPNTANDVPVHLVVTEDRIAQIDTSLR